MAVAGRLAREGVQARVLSMHTVKPLDAEAVLAAASQTKAIITLEEHSVIGGLGSAVAEVLAERMSHPILFRRLGLPSEFSRETGDQEYLRAIHGLSPDALMATLKHMLDLAQQ